MFTFIVGVFFHCAVMGIVSVSLSKLTIYGSSLSVICPNSGPALFVLVCHVVLILSVSFVMTLHVSGHCGRLMCPFFQSMSLHSSLLLSSMAEILAFPYPLQTCL